MFPQAKKDLFLQTTAKTAGATATAVLDTLGYDFAAIDVIATTSDNATNNPSVLKLAEADDTNATSFADITAFVGDGSGGFTIPASNTATASNSLYTFNVDLRHRKRYLKLTISPLASQSFTALAQLHRGEVSPTSAADVNALAVVSG